MADIFISYCSKDREVARKISAAITARGHSVWWDRDIVAGESFDQVIEHELESARAVIVVWTPDSVASEWVKNEASSAAERDVLLPVSLGAGKLPLEFRRRQAADLNGWDGDPSHEGFQSLCRGIDRLLGEGTARPQPTTPKSHPAGKGRRYLLWAAFALIFVAGSALLLFNRPKQEPGLATLVSGDYAGQVIADSKGSSRSDISVTVTQLGPNRVRVTSPYARIGTTDIEVTRVGNQVLNAGGDTPFIVNLDDKPPTLSVSPRNELSYHGAQTSTARE